MLNVILAASLLEALTISAPSRPTTLNVSFYCGCSVCCGQHSPEVGGHGLTTSGAHPIRGMSVAAPRGVPFGSVLCIEGVGVRVVQDRGGSIKGNRVDVFVHDSRDLPGTYTFSHQRALEMGRQHLRAWILGPYAAAEVVACEAAGQGF